MANEAIGKSLILNESFFYVTFDPFCDENQFLVRIGRTSIILTLHKKGKKHGSWFEVHIFHSLASPKLA